MNISWQTRFEIKQNRWVYVPSDESLEFGYEVKRFLEKKWIAPSYFYHLNVGGHVKLVDDVKKFKYFSKFDFENFFSQVTKNRISRCLKDYMSYERALEIATRSTVRCGDSHSVPYGFPQSMILASMVLDHTRLHKYIDKKLRPNGFFVGIYVDDIILAGNDPEKLRVVSEEFELVALQANLKFSEKKSVCVQKKITSFNIDIENSMVKIAYPRFEQFVKRIQTTDNAFTKLAIKGYVEKVNSCQANHLSTIGNLNK